MSSRRKKCRNPDCREWFHPFNSLDRACSVPCAIVVGNMDEAKRQRKENKRAKEKLKTKGAWTKEAQQAFNAYIRERDYDKPCISCGTYNPTPSRGGHWDCGHYRSTGANPELRFCELNVAKQCKRCNSHLSGNIANFRIGLRERIGDEALEWLEGPHEPARYTIEDLKAIRDEYRRKTRELQKAREKAA